ncbi:MAG: alpha-ketoglutarate-dependent dioxygenase AlkB family protein [Lysobacterales bacterium]
MRPALPEGFEYCPGYLEPDKARVLLQTLHQEMEWQQLPITLFGRTLLQPRLIGWCSDHDVHYRYSGTRLSPKPWLAGLDALRTKLCTEYSAAFNSVLVNAYRDGQDSMGWHADDEPELGPSPTIASVSLGQARVMRVRPRAGGPSTGFLLEHGSLLIMSGNSQKDWVHSVPKSRKPLDLRINLTFRYVRPNSSR